MEKDTFSGKIKIFEAAISSIGVIIALTGAFVAYDDYRNKARIQALSELHSAQMAVCQDVAEASAQFFDATNQLEFDKALNRFSNLKHGKALVILSPDVINKMLETYGAAINVKISDSDIDAKKTIRTILCNKPFEVVLACRRMIASGYNIQGGIQDLNDNYTMNWNESSCY